MSRRPLILAAIALAGIGVRLTYTATVGHDEQVTSVEGQLAHNIIKDDRWFAFNTRAEDYLAKLVAQRHRLIDPATVDYSYLDAHGQWYPEIGQSVGVSAIIAALWAVTGDERYVQLQVLQGIVDGLAALLVYWIAMRLFARRRPALIAAAIYALFPPLAWQTADAYNDIWAVDFTLVIVAVYLLSLHSGHRWRWLVVCGLCVGMGAYFRPQVLAIVPALSLAMASSVGWREALRQTVVTTTIGVVLIVPWTIRNYHDFHTFVPMRSAFWMTMLNGLNEVPNNYVNHDSEGALAVRIHRIRPELMPETPAWEALLKPIVVETLEHHPLFYLEVLAHRVALATVLMNETAWMSSGAGDVFGSAGGIFELDRQTSADRAGGRTRTVRLRGSHDRACADLALPHERARTADRAGPLRPASVHRAACRGALSAARLSRIFHLDRAWHRPPVRACSCALASWRDHTCDAASPIQRLFAPLPRRLIDDRCLVTRSSCLSSSW